MSGNDDRAAVHATVEGVVQGVGFRFFVRDNARVLGLSGWVRNQSDGQTVELVAEGEQHAIADLLRAVRTGPPGASVERVDEEWIEPQGTMNQFEIRH